jgi:hypothetical protein
VGGDDDAMVLERAALVGTLVDVVAEAVLIQV